MIVVNKADSTITRVDLTDLPTTSGFVSTISSSMIQASKGGAC